MSIIAKGKITLSQVNDAYTALLTPASCVIRADFDGSNPQLDAAKGSISLKRGSKEVVFHINSTTASSSSVLVSLPYLKGVSLPFTITAIDNTSLNGWVDFNITTDDGFNYTTTIRFPYSIVRESTMLDWIQDWEGSKTKVGGTYIMTPKLFVGKKEAIIDSTTTPPSWKSGALTGVYIGPDLLTTGESSAGIYGYLKSKEIFHLNANGGLVGGWSFNEAGLQSSNGIVNILAEGTVYAQNPTGTTPYWGLYADGHAVFANGNVNFYADGSADFEGKITSANGHIGGWSITAHQLYADRLIFDSDKGFIGINASSLQKTDPETGELLFPATPQGGLKIWHSSTTDFGMAAWSNSQKVFQLGDTNFIAGWKFNNQAFWTGSTSPYLTQGSFAVNKNELTVAPSGVRSSCWYIDADGTATFASGAVKFNADKGEMFGWLMRDNRFSSKHAALISSDMWCGLFVTPSDISEVGSSSLAPTIGDNGGVYIYSDDNNSIVRGIDRNGHTQFYLTTAGTNSIASWQFDYNDIYIGTQVRDDDGYAQSTNALILSKTGIHSPKWVLRADGSGALAAGKINWDIDGNLTVDAKVSANNITVGTISTADIVCAEKWALLRDGSGYLASRNITWDANGELTVKGNISVRTLRYMRSDIYDEPDENGWLVEDAFITAELGGDHIFRLPHLELNEFRVIKFMGALVSRSGGKVTFNVDNQNDTIIVGSDFLQASHYKSLVFEESLNYGIGYFEIIGRGGAWNETQTIWHIMPLYYNSNA